MRIVPPAPPAPALGLAPNASWLIAACTHPNKYILSFRQNRHEQRFTHVEIPRTACTSNRARRRPARQCVGSACRSARELRPDEELGCRSDLHIHSRLFSQVCIGDFRMGTYPRRRQIVSLYAKMETRQKATVGQSAMDPPQNPKYQTSQPRQTTPKAKKKQ